MVACHDNDDCTDNRLKNLKWAPPSQNYLDRDRNDKTPRGERQGSAKLTEPEIVEIRRLKSRGVSNEEIASQFNIHPGHVKNIARRVCWRHVA
jgi:DNA-binding NarL/FixJ family response regulator